MSATEKQSKVDMGTYSKDKTEMVGVRFSGEFLAKVRKASKSKMLNNSAFIRMVVNEKIKEMTKNGEI